MRFVLALGTLALLAASTAFAAEETWTGKISDSNCGATHKSAGEHAGKKMTEADCVKACIKGGAKYVFVEKGKVLNIANQDFAGLEEHAGKTVKLSGDLTGDTVTVTKIEAASHTTHKKKAKAA